MKIIPQKKVSQKQPGIPKEVSIEWFDRLVENSMLMPLVLKRLTKLERKLRRFDPELKDKRQILVWRNVGGLGDILMQSVIAKALKEKFPNSYITYQVPERYLQIPKHNPFVDKAEAAEEPFLEDGFDLSIKLSQPCPAAVYESTRESDITRNRIDLFLDKAEVDLKDKHLIYRIKDHERAWAEEFLKRRGLLNKKRIAFELRSAEPRRDWQGFKTLARLLKKEFKDIAIFIFDQDKKMSWKGKDVVDICGFPLECAAALMERMNLLICPDSGLAHLAGALDVPILGLFGPTNPYFRLATYKADWLWLNKRFKCMPCWYSYDCGNSRCMQAITPKIVLEKVTKILKDKQSP